jgi:XTP/dITP diphosphohydrolase
MTKKAYVLIVATRNAAKTREFQQILGSEFSVRDLTRCSDLPEIVESGSTFEENAVLKAVTISQSVAGLVLADDSGLEVDVLGGAPGIFSARYSGTGDDQKNLAKLLSELNHNDPVRQRRQARFRCVLAIARGGQLLRTFAGVAEGTITDLPTGNGGFGYDPVFVPQGYSQTFAELPPQVKNRLSHRGQAVSAALPFLRNALQTL